jgi:phosphatidylserine decarboxylase
MKRIPLAPEGWIFVLPPLILGVLALMLQWYGLALMFAIAVVLLLSSPRTPRPPGSERDVDALSPADGTVISVREIPDADPVWPGLEREISILLSVFDVHVNRAPISGRIVHQSYRPGAKVLSFAGKSSAETEQNLIVIEGEGTTVAVRQVAGLLARRIVFDQKKGDRVARGERLGMIRFGSRVDVFLPASADLKVGPKERVKVGITTIAELRRRNEET